MYSFLIMGFGVKRLLSTFESPDLSYQLRTLFSIMTHIINHCFTLNFVSSFIRSPARGDHGRVTLPELLITDFGSAGSSMPATLQHQVQAMEMFRLVLFCLRLLPWKHGTCWCPLVSESCWEKAHFTLLFPHILIFPILFPDEMWQTICLSPHPRT